MNHFSILPVRGSNAIGFKTIGLLLLLFFISFSRMFAAVSVSPSFGGTNICASNAIGGSAPGFITIGSLVISEGSLTDFNGTSITLAPPTGWQFNTGSLPTVIPGGSGLAVSAAFSSGNLVLTTTLSGAHTTSFNSIVIIGLQVQATGIASAAGNITNTAQSGTWTGLSLGTNFGSLSLEAQPGTVTIAGAGTFCGSSTNITASGGSGGTIYFQGTTPSGTSTASSSTTQTITTSGTYYFRSQAASGCWGYDASAVVVLNPIPSVVTVTGAGTFCGSTTLTATGGTGGTIYYQGTTSGGTSTATPATSQSVSVTGTYYFRSLSAAGCWGPEGSVSVTINPLPGTVTASGGGAFCGSTTITASGGSGGTIYFQGTTSGGTSTATPSSSQLITTSGTYYFRARTVLGCWGTEGSVAVTINAIPTAVTVGTAGTYCGSTTLTATGGTGGTIYYQGTTSGGTSTATPATSQSVSVTGTYYFRSLSAAGCWGPEGSVSVTINPLPGTVTASGGGAFCGSTTITASGGSGGTIYFQGTTSGGTSTATPSSSQLITTSGTYYFRARTVLGCWGTEGSVAVTINAIPTAVTVGTAGTYCGITTLTATGGTGGTIYYQGTTSGGTSTATPASSQSVSVTGTYYFRAQSGAGCWGNEGSVTVSINPNPAAITAPGVPTVCLSATTTLNSTTSGGTWSASNANISIGSTTGIVTGTTVGTSVASYILTASGCFATTVVTVNALPTVGAGANVAICSGANTTLTGTGATIYSWAPPATLSASTGATVTATPTATTTYTVTGTNSNGCVNTGNVTVSVNPLPALVTAIGAGTFCNSTTITASGGAGGTIYFQGTTSGGTSTATPSASQVVTVTGTYYFRAQTALGCWGPEGSVAVTINPNPTITSASGDLICIGVTASVTATPSSGATVRWYDSPTGGTLLATSNTYTVAPTTTSNYYVEATTGSASSLTTTFAGGNSQNGAMFDIAMLNSASISAFNIFSLTAGSVDYLIYYKVGTHVGSESSSGAWTLLASFPAHLSATTGMRTFTLPSSLSVTAGQTYAFYITGTTGLVSYTNSSPVGTVYASNSDMQIKSGVGKIYPFGATFTPRMLNFTVDYSLGCFTPTRTIATVTVNPLPTIASISATPSPVCQGAVLSLAAVSTTGTGSVVSYNWTGPNSYSSTTAGSTAVLTPTTTASGGVYSVNVTYTGRGCTSTTAVTSTAVTVNPTPLMTVTPTTQTVCNGANTSTQVFTSNVAGTTYTWSNNNTSIGIGASGSGSAIASFTATNSGTSPITGIFTVTPTAASCAGPVQTFTITVNPTANPGTISGTPTVCVSATTTLTASGSAGGVWSSTNTAVGTVSTSGVVSGITSGTTTISYTVTTVCGPIAATQIVTVNALPTVMPSIGTTICTGASTALNASGAVTYSWSPSTGLSATTGVPVTAAPTVTTTYTVIGTNASGCSNQATVTVTVNAKPTIAAITASPTNLCVGSTINLSAGSVTGVGALTSYNWSGPNSFSTTTSATSTSLTATSTAATGAYSLSVTYPGIGCTSTGVVSSAVTVNALPTIASLSATPSSICQGAVLSLTAVGTTGTGSVVSYNWTGPNSYSTSTTAATQSYTVPATTASGIYSVTVTYPGTGCTSAVVSSSAVTVLPLPNVYNVTGGGAYCAGASGVHIGLDWSLGGINYQLKNGATNIGSPVTGTNSALDFGFITGAGTYTVVATNISTTCSSNMAGSATVVINPLPTAFSVTGGGTACAGTAGVTVGMANSVSGINYQLYNGASATGSPVAGTGAAISFGSQTVSGTYSVLATNATTSCTNGMTGTVGVTINSAPAAFAVTGGGSYCAGGTGVTIGLAGSVTGFNYQLYNGATSVGSPVAGTGSSISFGLQTAAGTYTVLATNTTTTCTGAMTGSAVITINPLPTAYTVTGGGAYCAGGTGVTVGLSNSATGINYQLYNGASAISSPVAGSGSAISFGSQTLAGTYTVLATNTTTSCSVAMSGSAVVVMNALPVAQTITGGGSFCAGGAGVAVGLGSSQTGISYQLYSGPSTVGAALAGTGSALSFGNQATAGVYTVLATNTVTACFNSMSGSATVVVNPLPPAYVVTGGGNYCSGGSGVAIGLNGSNTGISYQLYNGAAVSGTAVAGTNAAISFGTRTASGTYSVLATNTVTGCTNNMLSTAAIIIDPLPTAMTITGGGSYCAGGSGVAIGLSSSNSGINYQLYNGASMVGSPVAGTGVVISFGSQTASGTYTVLATNSITSCTNPMTGSATIIINPLPNTQSVTGGGTYCENTGGVPVGLASSQTGINYRVYNGATAMGSVVAGTGAAISFGNQTLAGTYTVLATDATTSCTNAMTGSAIIIMNPAPTAYNVTGGGAYCEGGSGVAIGLSNSATGISYQLYRGATTVGTPVAGTGAAISFGLQTTAGTYSVLATNTTTSCTNPMNANAVVIVNPLPVSYTVGGGGSYCAGGAGLAVVLSSSQTGVTYQLYNSGTAVGTPMAGTGSSINFGNQTAAGTYTVLATRTATGCVNAMYSGAVVIVNPLPVVYNVTGGGTFCTGTSGVTIGLNMADAGINYTLYLGATAYSTVGGSGSVLDFGFVSAAGTYSVLATNSLTGCTSNMAGVTTVGINTSPTAFTVTGGGNYCSGSTGPVVGLSSSAAGISYRLYVGSTAIGAPVNGTGAAISFGAQTVSGTYSVLATSVANGCSTNMTGTVAVNINTAPVTFNVVGGGSYCVGGSGANISLDGSQTGVTYQAYLGTTPMGGPVTGTGGAISLGTYTAVGSYSAVATITLTGCTGAMTGSTAITTYALPVAYNVTGGGSYCSGGMGVAVGLSGSESGITYQLYNGSTSVASLSGTGSVLSFGPQFSAGSYSVRATNASTSCVNSMSGSVAVVVNPLPSVYLTTGGGSYCAGGSGFAVTLSGSQTGVNYQLFNGAVPVTGGFVPGSGTSINFGLQTAAGTYTVRATNPLTSCTSNMAGTPQIIVNPLPVTFAVTGGGSYCAGGTGVAIGLAGSTTGVNYRLFNGTVPVGAAIAGNGGAITFGTLTTAGTYTVQAVNVTTGCVQNMSGSASVVITPLPVAYTVTGGGNYCTGGAGVPVGLSWSASGVSYQLYKDGVASGTPVTGINGPLSFGSLTAVGTYSVAAVTTIGSCAQNMSGTVAVGINALPVAYTVSGTGSYCAGAAGFIVTLSGSETGVDYTLYNGSTPTTYTTTGTGSAISFGAVTAGNYSIVATNAATTCQNTMTGTANISVNALPLAYNVTGGGAHCAGAAGVSIYLSSSQSGVNYTLYNGTVSTGITVAGTGSTLSFGAIDPAGVYSVLATNTTTTCTNAMTGTATVVVNATPAVATVTGGGTYCAGGAGVVVGLSSSQSGVQYQLYNGTVAAGLPLSGSGAALSFGAQPATGVYSVMAVSATTSCARAMSGTVTVSSNPLPVAHVIIGGGAYCAGSGGSVIGLSGSASGITYRLYNGATPVGTPVAGTGIAISFGAQAATGSYSVLATNNTTGCTKAMTGTAVVSINAAPVAQSVTGSGSYCAGGAGMLVGLSNSEAGVSYTLYNGTTPSLTVSGTGGAINFGMQTAAGTYTVNAVNATTSCSAAMAGSAVIGINPLPVAYDVTGGGGYCTGAAGVSIGLSNSQTGVNYQLYNSAGIAVASIAGTGTALNFGIINAASVYTVTATNASSGCISDMSGEAAVVVNPLPVTYAVTGGGSYCTGAGGVAVGLSGSESGVSYRLYKDGIATATVVAGTGADLNFGLQLAGGTYTVMAENTLTSCGAAMAGTVVVNINSLPVTYAISAGGGFCQGTSGLMLSLSGSEVGVNYRLYNGATATGVVVAGTGGAIDFGMQPSGNYSVQAVNTASTCAAAMTGTAAVIMNTLPTVYGVTGSGGYCAATAGRVVSLTASQNNVNYQLYNGATLVGSVVAGTGGAITFGTQTAGNYTVLATNTTTGCTNAMSGNASVFINPLPNTYSVGGGGSFCSGGTGVAVTLNGSQAGVSYRLFNGTIPVGSSIAGTGLALNFGNQLTGGNYTVLATNTTTSCVATMAGTAVVVVNNAPVAYTVTGGGNYCPGGTGVHINLSGSAVGVNYQLYSGAAAAGAVVAGTGAPIDFGAFTPAGSYMVIATDATTACVTNMTGSAFIAVNPQPTAYTLSSSSSAYCAGGAGVTFSLSGSQVGVTYRLFNGTTPVGAVVNGNGSPFSFGLNTIAGSYTAIATDVLNGCTTTMTGTPSLVINPVPAAFTVSGGGSYCAGGAGAEVTLLGSESGINYQAFTGATAAGTAVAGTGAALSLGALPAGNYIVRATNPVTGCRTNMSGAVSVVMNAAPVAYSVNGGGQYCSESVGLPVGLSNSTSGIVYTLYRNGVAVTGASVVSTGGALSFGNQLAAGTYTVLAMNTVTACSAPMTGSVTISVNTTPDAQDVTGGGTICAGAPGVAVGLSGSVSGVNYRLYNGATAIGTPVSGTGGVISFGTFTTAGTYSVLATNATATCGRSMTGIAVINVNALPAIHAVNGGGNYCAGGAGVLVGLSTSTSGISYKLYQGATLVNTVTGTGAGIGFGMVTGTGAYTVLATDPASGCARSMSGSANVSVLPSVAPSITLNVAAGDTICAGTPAVFTTTASNEGTAPVYHWSVNGVSIPVADASYSYLPANGDVVAVSVTSSAACAIPATVSDSRTMTVKANQMPSVVIAAHSDTLCAGGSVTLIAATTYGGNAPAFVWIKNGVAVGTDASVSFVPADGDVLYCRMTSNYACRLASLVTSANDTLDVFTPNAPSVVILAPQGTTVAPGQDLTLTASVVNGYQPSYQWYINGAAVHGATVATFTYNNYADQDTVTCNVTNNTPCGQFGIAGGITVSVQNVGVAGVTAQSFDVRLLPNPSAGTFTIKGTVTGMDNEAATIEVTNMLGQVVYNGASVIRNGRIDKPVQLSGTLANGIYLVSLRTANASKVFHLVIEQ